MAPLITCTISKDCRLKRSVHPHGRENIRGHRQCYAARASRSMWRRVHIFVIGRRKGTSSAQSIVLTGRSGRALLNRGSNLFEPQMKFAAALIVAFLGLPGMAQAQTADQATT